MSGVEENSMQENMARILSVAQVLRQTVDKNADATNTNRLVGLVTLALLGEVVYGPGLSEMLGFEENHDGGHSDFRKWLASLVLGLDDNILNKLITEP